MIKDLITLLKLANYYGESEIIEIAKGRYKYPKSFKEFKRSVNRIAKWQ